MSKNTKIIIAIIVLVVAGVYLYPRFLSDRTKIVNIVKETAELTQKRAMLQFMKHFGKTYKDDSGLGFDDLRYLGIRVFQMYKKIEVSYSIHEINIDSKNEKAQFNLDLFIKVLERGQELDLIHGARKTNTFMISMEKKDGKWVFISSRKPE